MIKKLNKMAGSGIVLVLLLLFVFVLQAHAGATIPGLTGTTFDLVAKEGYVSSPDGGANLLWGFANAGGMAQYPGPTLIVNEGDTVTINLTNNLPVAVSMVFPGQTGVTATGGTAGLLTNEAPALTGTVTYSFTVSSPGTYTYYSGTDSAIQVEMGLFGAIIVRPAGFDPLNPKAYNHDGSAYDHEYLFLLSEIDPEIHHRIEMGLPVDTTAFYPVYWFINGRNAPDTLAPASIAWLPHQPYNCLPRMRPGEKLLLRLIGGGRDFHPFHHHGNNSTIIARDGRLLSSATDDGVGYPDLAESDFTIAVAPGETIDAIFEWTGKGMGWDIYGHAPGDPMEPNEYAADHGKPFPVTLPGQQDLTFGGFYSGSPYLGGSGALPTGEGGLNPFGAFVFMWHSHNEKEMTNFDIFPGGLMTQLYVEPWSVSIP
ncbi:MAG: multicopper oxidase domain-containing protein [Deltaproteobacteria bacterium]|nr:multicopper oxidase domain-containing protein [Deltaproteobacteria bacterium]